MSVKKYIFISAGVQRGLGSEILSWDWTWKSGSTEKWFTAWTGTLPGHYGWKRFNFPWQTAATHPTVSTY